MRVSTLFFCLATVMVAVAGVYAFEMAYGEPGALSGVIGAGVYSALFTTIAFYARAKGD